ncbi:APC family permease [Porticoccus sp.]
MTTQVTLLRNLSLAEISLYGIGTIVGAGIYVLLGSVVAESGLMTPWAFMLAAIVVSFSAYSYAQMSHRFPRSAGEAVYILEGLHSRHLATLAGYAISLGGIVSAATLTRGFTGYFSVLFNSPSWLLITLLACFLTAIAAWGVKQSVTLAILTTLLEISGLLLALIVSSDEIIQSGINWSSLSPRFDTASLSLTVTGAFLAFYAFIGFEDMVNMAEEVKNPKRNLPLSIAIAVVTTTLLYAAIAIVALQTLPMATLAGSPAPLALLIEHNSTVPVGFMALISIVAIINGALIQILMVSRVLYGMARQRLAPLFLGTVNRNTRTPLPATLLTGIAVLGFALWLPIATLAAITSTLILIVFILVNLALLSLNYRHGHRGLLPLGMPVFGAILSAGFLVIQIWSQ